MTSFPAVKRQYLRLQTSKLKTVESFEKFRKKFLDEELFSPFEAFYGTKFQAYFFFAQILKEILKKVQLRLGNVKRPRIHKIWVNSV